MDAMQEDMDDSRTSAVGRKRNLEELQETDNSRSPSPANDGQRIKRTKEDGTIADSIDESGISLNTAAPFVDSSPSHLGGPSQLPHSSAVPAPVGAWNKGVQSGLRISFGSRAKTFQPTPLQKPSQGHLETPPFAEHVQDRIPTSLDEDEGMVIEDEEAFADPSKLQTYGRNSDNLRDVMIIETNGDRPQTTIMSEEEGEIASTPVDQHASGQGLFLRGQANNANALPQYTSDLVGQKGGKGASTLLGPGQKPGGIIGQLSSSNSDPESTEADPNGGIEELDSHPHLVAVYQPIDSSASAEKVRKAPKLSKEERKKFSQLQSYELLTEEAQAMFGELGTSTLSSIPTKYSVLQAHIAAGRTFYPRKSGEVKNFYSWNRKSFDINEIMDMGKPVLIQELTFDQFALHMLKDNPGKKISANLLPPAFKTYINWFYASEAVKFSDGVDTQPSVLKEKTVVGPYRGPPGQRALFERAEDILANITPMTGTETLSEAAEAGSDGTIATEIDLDQPEILQIERDLQIKYFPSAADCPASYHCLVCRYNTHLTIDCPSMSCTVCKGNHAMSACGQYRRCNKCRQRGHDQSQCPERLALSKAEQVPCDHCGSLEHIEAQCHTIWRTFNADPETVRKVQQITVHCYICGGEGHFGPECGLYRDCPLLTGGRTWSQENLATFIDPSSTERALSAGIDYSLGSRPQKQLSIKGKAHNPINLDDSDEDVTFIQEKIRGPKTRAQIMIAGAARFGQAPQGNQARGLNSPQVSRQFNESHQRSGPSVTESMRYGRERTFSPPPRFDGMRDDYYESAPHPQRANVYRPLPPQAPQPRFDYNPIPQGQLSGRPSGNNGRGGRGGRSDQSQKGGGGKGTQGAQQAHNTGGGGGKKKKKKNRGGGNVPGRGN